MNIAGMLLDVLSEYAYEGIHFYDANSALEWLKTNDVDLLISDIGLPGISGLQFCSLVRTTERIASLPILMLTSRDDEYHKVTALRTGADDYMVKPFSNNELIARIESLLRRCRPVAAAARTLRSGGLELNLDTGDVFVDKVPARLLPKEYALLELFLSRKDQVHTWETIRDKAWGLEAAATRDTIKVTVHRLKSKLGKYGECVEPVTGFGYRWAERFYL